MECKNMLEKFYNRNEKFFDFYKKILFYENRETFRIMSKYKTNKNFDYHLHGRLHSIKILIGTYTNIKNRAINIAYAGANTKQRKNVVKEIDSIVIFTSSLLLNIFIMSSIFYCKINNFYDFCNRKMR